jgi:hypothetical protein
MKPLSLLIAILLVSLTALAQKTIEPGVRQADKAEAQFEKNVPPPPGQARQVDATNLKRDADQLANLAQSIPADIDNVQKGILPKDLIEKLKRIEKLSRHLRSELSQ